MKITTLFFPLLFSIVSLWGQSVLDTDHKHVIELSIQNEVFNGQGENLGSLVYSHPLTSSLDGRLGFSYVTQDEFGAKILQTDADLFRRDSQQIQGIALRIGLEREKHIGKKVTWYLGGDIVAGYNAGTNQRETFRQTGGSLFVSNTENQELRQYDIGFAPFVGLKFYTCNWLGFTARTGITTQFRIENELTRGTSVIEFNQNVFQTQIGMFVRI